MLFFCWSFRTYYECIGMRTMKLIVHTEEIFLKGNVANVRVCGVPSLARKSNVVMFEIPTGFGMGCFILDIIEGI